MLVTDMLVEFIVTAFPANVEFAYCKFVDIDCSVLLPAMSAFSVFAYVGEYVCSMMFWHVCGSELLK
jgi:hypothetical protein